MLGLAAALTASAVVPGDGVLTTVSPDAPLRIYIDADRTHAVHAGDAIEAGVRAAIRLAGGQVSERAIEVVALDHRSNTKRSRRNLEQALLDPNGIAVIGGLHSPPLLRHRDWINEHGLLLLDPWAAAGGITRPESGPNWIFRLSIDDANAGTFIARFAVRDGVRRPTLLLEDTGWGRANAEAIAQTFSAELGDAPPITWIPWGISEDAIRIIVKKAVADGADAFVFVGNTPEGASLIRVLAELEPDLRPALYSHWGIIGGDLLGIASRDAVEAVDLRLIQTRFDLQPSDPSALVFEAFRSAQAEGFFVDLDAPRRIDAPTGFVHAFDLTRILLAAIGQTGLTGDIEFDRDEVRRALESLETDVVGIVKSYRRPFRPQSQFGDDAHEALGIDDYVMARITADGTIEAVPAKDVAAVVGDGGAGR